MPSETATQPRTYVMKSGVIELEDWQLEHVVGGIDAAFDPRELFGIELP